VTTKAELTVALSNLLKVCEPLATFPSLPPVISAAYIDVRDETARVLEGQGGVLDDLDKLVSLYLLAKQFSAARKRQCWRCDHKVQTATCTCAENYRCQDETEVSLLALIDSVEWQFESLTQED
jgi:hypothetical protein